MPRYWTKKNPISHDRLIEMLRYDPATGHFYWRVNRRGGNSAGCRAGTVARNGYRVILIDGYGAAEHTLAWFYVFKVWPPELDHRNLAKDDNRLSNLRAATRAQNCINTRLRPRSVSGFKGVRQVCTGKYTARLTVARRNLHLGTFDTPEEAHVAYMAKAVELFGEFARAA